MGDYEDIGNGLVSLARLAFWGLVASVPLAIWKLVDIAVWLWRHIDVSWGA